MTPRLSKKSVIRDYVERERAQRVGAEEAAVIRRELAKAMGPGARISNDYLLEVLNELGVRAGAELGGFSPELLPLLQYHSLEAAQATLRALDERYRAALAEEQREPAEDCRRAAMLVRRRAALVARNQKVAPGKRAIKEEIARWFTIWLQTPDLFFDWLDLRQQTEEFRRLSAR